jgi:hypothetical protein
MRDGLRDADVYRIAALLRGGASWDDAVSEFRDVMPEVLAGWRAHIVALSECPGPVAYLPSPTTPEEERQRLRAWLRSQGHGEAPTFKVIRALGSRR